MAVGNRKVLPQELFRLGPSPDGKEVDRLDEKARLAATGPAHCVHEPREARDKRSSPMRSSGPLGMSRMPVASTTIAPGRPRAKALVPLDVRFGDEPVFGRAPGDHGRHPGTASQVHGAHRIRAKKQRAGSLVGSRPSPRVRAPLDPLRGSPHVLARYAFPMQSTGQARPRCYNQLAARSAPGSPRLYVSLRRYSRIVHSRHAEPGAGAVPGGVAGAACPVAVAPGPASGASPAATKV